jgi:hypothetical protein
MNFNVKSLAIAVFCFLCSFSSYSQSNNLIVKSKGGYMLNDKKLKGKDLKTLLKTYPESSAMLKKASTNYTIGYVFLIPGSLAVLTGAVMSFASTAKEASDVSNGNTSTSTSGGASGLGPILVGGGLVLISVPFILTGNSQMKKSIKLYNSKQTTGQNINGIKVNLRPEPTGISIVCQF